MNALQVLKVTFVLFFVKYICFIVTSKKKFFSVLIMYYLVCDLYIVILQKYIVACSMASETVLILVLSSR